MAEPDDAFLDQLAAAVAHLPPDKRHEVLDFAGYLQQKYGTQSPPRGSAEAILPYAGSFEFAPGELEQLLAEIEQLRDLDVTNGD